MADFEQPESRNEAILQNMLGANNELLEPVSRIEALLLQLLGSSTPAVPITAGIYGLRVTIVEDAPVYEWVLINPVGD